ncbi:16S rRNA (cytosine(1402)-N(4))-methyltransferase RsmH [Candidatus Dojkabacteria bacterium]|uniref:Ribosomal RNA small subunit methyltransferase H n=1 Tax=Candidatus Dojkabacteria bacterium TaxID=2099670 RepID=A0A955I8E8_9BACT|nr:16S rRNA (cytosine(1402)-N(4))-methyltransferase RsmH [Candidatus Dojkabacteria bacterium]
MHKPVLLKELIDSIDVKKSGTYLDVTLGGGGHSLQIIERLRGNGNLVVMDVNKKALENFKEMLIEEGFKEKDSSFTKGKVQVTLVNENFRHLDEVLKNIKIKEFNGIIADLGLSTDQIYQVEGISYLKNTELDMRLDDRLGVKASDLLNALYKTELENMFKNLADIKFEKELVRKIIEYRKTRPFKTTKQLKHLIQEVVPLYKRKGTHKNPEAKVFQALRIAVNDEIGALKSFLPLAFEALAQEGILSVISFHSGEDRIVKNFIRDMEEKGQIEIVEKLIKPSQLEINTNPRSSSARLRVMRKL